MSALPAELSPVSAPPGNQLCQGWNVALRKTVGRLEFPAGSHTGRAVTEETFTFHCRQKLGEQIISVE